MTSANGTPREGTLAAVLADVLWQVGVRYAFGITGAAIAHLGAALAATAGGGRAVRTIQMRHEGAAASAALGVWEQTGRPAAVFVTTGPGLSNALTGLETARAAGAKLVLLSPRTSAGERGRGAVQETGPEGLSYPDLYVPGRLFDMVAQVESPAEELETIGARLAAGFAGSGSFFAHISVSFSLQDTPAGGAPVVRAMRVRGPAPPADLVDEIVALLRAEPFAVWLGWGARHHADAIRELLDLTGAPALCSPRAKGIADDHPQFAGGTGNGGHGGIQGRLDAAGVRRFLVLGSALGEATRGRGSSTLAAPPAGFLHVDLNPHVFGCAYPAARTLGIQADVGELLACLLDRRDELVRHEGPAIASPFPPPPPPQDGGPVNPAALMAALQRVVDQTEVPIWAEASTAMFLGAKHLRLPSPGRFLLENRSGAMGAACGAVIGAAAARGDTVIALTGDAALMMNDEISTAATEGLRCVWVVLGDGGMQMVRFGMEQFGYGPWEFASDFPPVDWAAVAVAKGAAGERVDRESELDGALERALRATGPYVVDVRVDRAAAPPLRAMADPGQE